MKKISFFFVVVFVTTTLIGAGCSLSDNGTEKAEDLTNKTKTSKETEVPAKITPLETATNFLTAATSGDKAGYDAYLVEELKTNTTLFPEEKILKTQTPTYGPPLEFGDDILIKALFGDGNDAQRFVYFLMREGDGWKIYDVKQGAAKGASGSAHNDAVLGTIDQNEETLKEIQSKVAGGENEWRLDPYMVALAESVELGFDPHEDAYTLKNKTDQGENGGTADIEVVHNLEFYDFQMNQPIDSGDKGIWAIASIAKRE